MPNWRLETLGFGLAGTEDETVEAGLVDYSEFLASTKGTHNLSTLFIIIQTPDGIRGVAISENLSDVSSHKPRLAIVSKKKPLE